MHRSDRRRLELGQLLQVDLGLPRIGHVATKRSTVVFQKCVAYAIDYTVARQRIDIPKLMKEVRAEKSAIRFFEQQSGFPAMRQMRRVQKTEIVFAGRERVAIHDPSRRSRREIVNADLSPDKTAHRLSVRR